MVLMKYRILTNNDKANYPSKCKIYSCKSANSITVILGTYSLIGTKLSMNEISK